MPLTLDDINRYFREHITPRLTDSWFVEAFDLNPTIPPPPDPPVAASINGMPIVADANVPPDTIGIVRSPRTIVSSAAQGYTGQQWPPDMEFGWSGFRNIAQAQPTLKPPEQPKAPESKPVEFPTDRKIVIP